MLWGYMIIQPETLDAYRLCIFIVFPIKFSQVNSFTILRPDSFFHLMDIFTSLRVWLPKYLYLFNFHSSKLIHVVIGTARGEIPFVHLLFLRVGYLQVFQRGQPAFLHLCFFLIWQPPPPKPTILPIPFNCFQYRRGSFFVALSCRLVDQVYLHHVERPALELRHRECPNMAVACYLIVYTRASGCINNTRPEFQIITRIFRDKAFLIYRIFKWCKLDLSPARW